jgi:serine kinase of HPr protein (carbohydrate metabolism regulator)
LIVHAGLIAQRLGGHWRGVLIEGPSGCGKSDLALRALGEGFRLVADDRVVLWLSGGQVFGRAPDTLGGALEVRGLAVVSAASVGMAQVVLVARNGSPERIPRLQTAQLLGVAVPRIDLDLLELSAPAKLGRALALFDEAHKRRI